MYNIKYITDGSVDKYKAMFVSHGFSQKEGIGYEDIFVLMDRYTTIIYIIPLASVLG